MTEVFDEAEPGVGGFPEHGNVAEHDFGAGVVAFVEADEEFVEFFLAHAVGGEEKLHTVHLFPVLVKDAVFLNFLVKRGAGKGGEFGKVEVVDGQGENIVHAFLDRLFALSGQTHHQQALDPDTRLFDEANFSRQHVEIGVLAVLGQ